MNINRILFPAPITAQLELLADMLLHSEVNLQDLPVPLAEFYHLGQNEGRAQLAPRIQDLERECDRLYLAVAHPRDRATELQARLDRHFTDEADRFYAEPVPAPKAA